MLMFNAVHRRCFPRGVVTAGIRIVDIIDPAASTKDMLNDRVAELHRPPNVLNWIVCSAPDAGDSHGETAPIEALRSRGVPVLSIEAPRRFVPVAVGRYLIHLVRFLRRIEPTIVHTHGFIAGCLGRIAARLTRVPIIVHSVQDLHRPAGASRLRWRTFHIVERALASFTDVLLVQNREDLQLIRQWRWPTVPARLIGNVMGVEKYAGFRRRHSGPGKVIACVGRFEPVKNHRDLLRTFARVHSDWPEARLRLIGDGPLRAECERLAIDSGIATVTDFLGYRDDVDVLLADVDVAVLVSREEGLSRALLEPMAAGIPVVGWNVKNNAELVAHDRTGLLAPAGDLDATAAHIGRLLADAPLRQRLGAAAAEDVRRRFENAAFAERLRGVYVSLLGDRGFPATPALSLGRNPPMHGHRVVSS